MMSFRRQASKAKKMSYRVLANSTGMPPNHEVNNVMELTYLTINIGCIKDTFENE